MLPVNSPAPDFTLPDADGKLVSLSDFRGRKVVLYFYPKDNTPGCTSQACAFAERYDAFQDKGAVVIGISKDSAVSHRKFADRYNLPFILLSEKKMYGKPVMGVVRTTYVIDEQGLIISAEENVKAAGNPADVLLFLDLPD